MKAFVFVLAALLASVAAVPSRSADALDRETDNFVERLIVNIINRITNGIQERGFDPIAVEEADGDFSLLDILSASGTVRDLVIEGVSNIVVKDVTFSVRTGTVAVDLVWPKLSASAGALVGEATVFGNELEGSISGSVVVKDLGLSTRFRVSFWPGVSIRELSAELTVGDVDSRLNVVLFGRDVSERLNDLLNNRLPALLETYNDRIREVVERIVRFIINRLL